MDRGAVAVPAALALGAGGRSQRLAKPEQAERWLFSKLPEWEEAAPRPAPRTVTLDDADVAERLALLTGSGAEQRDRASAIMPPPPRAAFAPRDDARCAQLVLAEAGTGIGKTLGYLAPASLWAEQAGGAVWVSTFTKALQRQLAHETARLYPRRRRAPRAGRHAQGPRELPVPAQSRGCAAGRVRRAARRSSRNWSRAGRRIAPTATWSAATCPAGCRRCSAATDRPR